MRPKLVFVTVALTSATALAAPYTPVLRHEVERLEQKKARLYVARPCSVHPLDYKERDRAVKRLLPGDTVRVEGGHRRPTPLTLVARHRDLAYRVKVACLAKRPPDYSYRGKASFKRFYHGLVRDLPRLMGIHLDISRKHKHHIPVTDPKTRKLSRDWNRSRAVLNQIKWVRSQFFSMGYSGRSERTVLRKEADWILKRGEAFIRGFSGGADKPVKEELKKIYLLLNRLVSVPSYCARLRRLEDRARKAREEGERRYKDLEPAHRARLISEDIAKLHSKQAEVQTKLNTVIVEVRSGLMALGVKAR
jgi:hypothetical protein